MDAHSSHQGYFSIDKKKGKKARFVEGKVDRKTQTSDDTDAYDLIMRDKERLLSLGRAGAVYLLALGPARGLG